MNFVKPHLAYDKTVLSGASLLSRLTRKINTICLTVHMGIKIENLTHRTFVLDFLGGGGAGEAIVLG